jgi:hypothetical protein
LIKDLSGDAEGKPITRVNLNCTKVTDNQLRELAELKGLQELWLGHTGISDAG